MRPPPKRGAAGRPGKGGTSGNPKLSALRVNGLAQFLAVVKTALRSHEGRIEPAATALGVHRVTMLRWVHEYPEVRAALDAARRRAEGERLMREANGEEEGE